MLKINFKNKKYYFNKFSNKKYFKKQVLPQRETNIKSCHRNSFLCKVIAIQVKLVFTFSAQFGITM